ncbi:MAG: phosphatase PAP2 family protein [Bacteroidia bacterium]|nr:phosphatase PAP2 family protein [Bacteroidia bacterium]
MLSLYGYEGSFLLLNSHSHLPVTDFLGRHLTHLADVLILPLVVLLIAWKKDKALAPTTLFLMVLTGLTAQALKMWVFDDWMRPTVVCAGNPDFVCLLETPPRVHSFPSGHATTFAAGGLAFAWLVREWKGWAQIGVGLITIALSYTRVHIGVHFLGDIFVGSALGAIGGLFLFGIVYPRFQQILAKIPESRLESLGVVVIVLSILILSLRFIQLEVF